ncbi:uncharacterized protein [Apostichopus japonicus]|uniref:uncharacterized protein isoform X2 n=1 Tax=Stichopus japonicus TaxID=307972 RepID=UPI003AB888A9
MESPLTHCMLYRGNQLALSWKTNVQCSRYLSCDCLSIDMPCQDQLLHIGVNRLEEGNFTLWAKQKFTNRGSSIVTDISGQDETMLQNDVIDGNGARYLEPGDPNVGSGTFGISGGRNDKQLQDGYGTSDDSSRLGQSQVQILAGTLTSHETDDRANGQWGGRNTFALEEPGVVANNNPAPPGDHNDGNANFAKTTAKLDLTSLLPLGGNTLPNYFLCGIDRGLRPVDYKEGVLAFLHHNKAAGSSIKICLTSMQRKGILTNHSLLIYSSKVISTLKPSDIVKHNAFAGGYSFGVCQLSPAKNCSYFTVLRDPYDRVISSYYYCRVQYWDQLCGPLRVGNFTLREWAIYQGSYFFYQLLMQRGYCRNNDVIHEIFDNGDIDFIPKGSMKYINYNDTHQCWFKEKAYLSNVLNNTGKMHLLENVLDNLESWFSVIGLTEDFDLSLKMLSVTYDLPFYRRCRGKQINKSPSKRSSTDINKNKDKRILQASPEVKKALFYDIQIYEKGRAIFDRQKQRLKKLKVNIMEH